MLEIIITYPFNFITVSIFDRKTEKRTKNTELILKITELNRF